VESEVLDQQSHQSSREEEAKSVLEAKGELIFTACAMFLHICDQMKYKRQQKLIE
jgi:hypothetical protein